MYLTQDDGSQTSLNHYCLLFFLKQQSLFLPPLPSSLPQSPSAPDENPL